MFGNKGKRSRAKSNELPKRYRCRDKYHRALDAEMNKFVTGCANQEESEESGGDCQFDSGTR